MYGVRPDIFPDLHTYPTMCPRLGQPPRNLPRTFQNHIGTERDANAITSLMIDSLPPTGVVQVHVTKCNHSLYVALCLGPPRHVNEGNLTWLDTHQ